MKMYSLDIKKINIAHPITLYYILSRKPFSKELGLMTPVTLISKILGDIQFELLLQENGSKFITIYKHIS